MKIRVIISGESAEIVKLVKEIADATECDTIIIQASAVCHNHDEPTTETQIEKTILKTIDKSVDKQFAPETATCENCKNPFTPKTYKSRFCSEKCAAAAYNRKYQQDHKLKKIKQEIPVRKEPKIDRNL